MITIVPYRSSHFDDAVEIFTQLSRYYLKENASDRETVANNLKDNIVAPHSAMRLLLAYENTNVCGFACYTIMYPATKETGQLFLKELFISTQYTRKGVGETLMAYLANIAIKKNCSRFDWTSNEDSESAKRFYTKLGAPIIEKKKYYRLAKNDLQNMAELLPRDIKVILEDN